jgi:hypothetical protein
MEFLVPTSCFVKLLVVFFRQRSPLKHHNDEVVDLRRARSSHHCCPPLCGRALRRPPWAKLDLRPSADASARVEFEQLKALATCRTCDWMRLAIRKQESSLLASQIARPPAVQVNDVGAVGLDNIVGRELAKTPRALRFSHFLYRVGERNHSTTRSLVNAWSDRGLTRLQ